MNIHPFSVWVTPPRCTTLYEDHGILLLPESYTPDGAPTRLVVSCHGAGGTVTTDDAQVAQQVLTQYLLANGYAVMDVGGLPPQYAAEQGVDVRNNIGCPMAVDCYVEAYTYCINRFNLYPEVLIHGASMGGISSTNLVLSGRIPVLAHSAFCPVLDTYNEIYLHPWSDGLPRVALGILYGLEQDAHGEYIYDEAAVQGHNPARDPRAVSYPVPVTFWHCEDDPVVSCAVTETFVQRIRDKGGEAHLRTFPHGGHEPQLVGEPVAAPVGNVRWGAVALDIPVAVEEAFCWLRRFG